MKQTTITDNTNISGMHMSKIMSVLDSANMGIWRVTICEGKKPCTTLTPTMLEMMGLGRDSCKTEEEIRNFWLTHIYSDDLGKALGSLEKMKSGVNEEVIYRWNHPTLGVRYMRCGGVGHKDEAGTLVVDGYNYDVTASVNRHNQNMLVVKSFANTYSSIFYGDVQKDWYTSYIYNRSYISEYISKTGCMSEALQRFVFTLCHPCDRQRMLDFIDLSTLDKRLSHRNSISTQYRGTGIDWLEFEFIVCDRTADGLVSHLVVTIKDISAQKKEEEVMLAELRDNVAANNAKTMMMQNMTHEIRTPLNALYGFSQLLCMPDGSYSEEEKTEFYDYIYNSFNMLSMIIDDVLDLTDVEHGNYRVQTSRFAINRVCRDAVQMAELRKQGPVRMYFTTDFADDYMIESDSRRIQQVLVNLLGNACKHTIEGEIHLHLSSIETPGRLTFSVTDTGTGIPTGKGKEIFERYKKMNDTVHGSGLGLHICCTIAEKLGAEIKLDESYTDGARFLMIL